jgi:hypothetical protein
VSRSYGKPLKKSTSRQQVRDLSESPGHTDILHTPMSFIPGVILAQMVTLNIWFRCGGRWLSQVGLFPLFFVFRKQFLSWPEVLEDILRVDSVEVSSWRASSLDLAARSVPPRFAPLASPVKVSMHLLDDGLPCSVFLISVEPYLRSARGGRLSPAIALPRIDRSGSTKTA